MMCVHKIKRFKAVSNELLLPLKIRDTEVATLRLFING